MARAAAEAGLRGGGSPASGVEGFPGATGCGNWRKGIKESGCSSPRVQVGRGGRAGGVVVVGRRRLTAGLGVRALQGSSGRLGPTARILVVL
jgi:hypothetical protein